jgi:hypothetical protein
MVAWIVVAGLVVVAVMGGRGTRTPGLLIVALVMGLLAGAFAMLSPTPAGYDALAAPDRIGGHLMVAAGPPLAAAMFVAAIGCLFVSMMRPTST